MKSAKSIARASFILPLVERLTAVEAEQAWDNWEAMNDSLAERWYPWLETKEQEQEDE
jgi:hypothetical protein